MSWKKTQFLYIQQYFILEYLKKGNGAGRESLALPRGRSKTLPQDGTALVAAGAPARARELEGTVGARGLGDGRRASAPLARHVQGGHCHPALRS